MRWTVPDGDGVRCDTFCHDGAEVVAHYDSMLAKLICWAPDRTTALDKVDRALARTRIEGVDTTAGLQRALVRHADVRDDRIHTRGIEDTFLPGWTAWESAR